MKIDLIFKTFTIKASFLFVLMFMIFSIPIKTEASFFSSISSFIFGNGAQASEIKLNEQNGTDVFVQNIQNMQLLESSINSNTKHLESEKNIPIIQDGALASNAGLIGGSGIENISSGGVITYIVKKGDTLSEIAEEYDISTNTIRWENNITGQTIRIGQKLNILPVTGVKHKIKKGDNLGKIAIKYDAQIEDILIFNDITKKDILKLGDIIYVPNGVIKTKVVFSKSSYSKSRKSISSSNLYKGYYLRPAPGRVTSPYGPRRRGFHYGIDIGNKRGTKVIAAASGMVEKVVNYCKEGKTSCGGRYGNYIVIKHSNGTKTRYAHLSKAIVVVGQVVSQGSKIGTIGNTGRSTGPHVHFQIEKNNGSTIRPRF